MIKNISNIYLRFLSFSTFFLRKTHTYCWNLNLDDYTCRSLITRTSVSRKLPGTNTNQTFCLHWKFTARPCQTMPVVLAYRVRRVIDSEFSKFPRMPGRFGPGPTSTINRIDKPWHGRAIVDVHTARFYLWTMLRWNRLEDIVVDKLTVTNLQVDRTDWKNEFDWIRTKPVNLFEQLESCAHG